MSLAWRFHNTGKNMLWVNMLKSKYNNNPRACSLIWKSVLASWNLFQEGLSCVIGDGCYVSFQLINGVVIHPLDLKIFTINQLVLTFLEQNLNILPVELPTKIINKIISTLIRTSPQIDYIIWRLYPNGSFFTKSGYNLLYMALEKLTKSTKIKNLPLAMFFK